MKAWLPILAHSARRRNKPAELVLVDGFAGRGTYSDGEPGSPLILRGIARDVVTAGIADEVELFFVERDVDNHAQLSRVLAAEPVVAGVVSNPPEHAEFAAAARRILGPGRLGNRPRPAFWFVDPFGFSGMPLSLMRQILAPPRSEVYVTFMVREANRFLETPQHQPHIAETLGLSSEAYERAIAKVRASGRAAQALRDLYQQRLLDEGGAKYVWTFRVAQAGEEDTIYYLMHASTHPKAYREMKKATFDVGGWAHAFLGADDVAVTGQRELPLMDEVNADMPTLKRRLLEVFAGEEVAYDPPFSPHERSLLNEACPDPQFFKWVDGHFHRAIEELISEGAVAKIPVTTKGKRGLSGSDRVRFPGGQQLSF